MKKEKIIEALKTLIEEKEEKLNDFSRDFITDHYYSGIHYLSDAFWEYADSNTSIYCYDQKKYYYENPEQCEDALMEYYSSEDLGNYIKEHGLEDLICHAGAVGELNALLHELYDDEEEIKAILSAYEMIRRLENEELSAEEVADVDDAISELVSNID